jgi:hypothetical protein
LPTIAGSDDSKNIQILTFRMACELFTLLTCFANLELGERRVESAIGDDFG